MPKGDALLMAHLLGALDPGDALALEERLQEDPRGRFRRSGLGFLAGARSAPGGSAVDLAVDAAPLLSGDGPQRPGDRASLKLKPPVPPGEIRPVLWRETPGGRERLFPTAGGRWVALDRLRREGDACILDLVLAGPPGLHRYTLVLLPEDLFPAPWPEADPRWEGLWEAFSRGELPGAQVEIEVSP